MSSKIIILCRYSANVQPTYQEVRRPQLELNIEIPDWIKVEEYHLRSWGGLPKLPNQNGMKGMKWWMKAHMEYLAAIVRLFFCALNMVSLFFQIHSQNCRSTSAFFILLVIIFDVWIITPVYHLDVAGSLRLLHQPPHLPAHLSPGKNKSLCAADHFNGRATGSAASRGAVEP